MKKLIALVAAAAMLVSVAAAGAAGKTTTYNGEIDNGGTIQLKVKKSKKKGKKKTQVVLFRFEGLPVACGANGAGTTSGALDFKVPVKRGKFEIDAIIGKPSNPKSQLTAEGRISRSTAEGTIRVHGSEVPLDNNAGTGDCESGESDWSASK